MQQSAIERIRRFNRTVTEGIGVLDDHFLGRDRPIGESRVLWEIGRRGAEIRDLRGRLGLDSGYASRLLGSLSRQGLIREQPDQGDKRVRRATLTRKGLAERAELDRRSDALAVRILEPLTERQRAALVAAMTDVERLLRASMVRFTVENPQTRDARWCFEQYFAELNERFDAGFDPAQTISATVDELTRPAGLLLVGRLHGRPVGCGALKFHGKRPAELKRMWVAPESRGLGLGSRLLRELEQHARAAGTRVVRLETNRSLREAISLYRQSGYVEVEPFNDEPYAHHWFEKRLRR